MFLRHPATVLTGLALALASGPQPAPKPTLPPRTSAEPGTTASTARADQVRANEPLARAIRAARGGDLEEATRLIEEVLAAEPENRQALLLRVQVTSQRAGRLERPESSTLFLQAAETMRRLAATHKDLDPAEVLALNSALYNEACAAPSTGRPRRRWGRWPRPSTRASTWWSCWRPIPTSTRSGHYPGSGS